MFNPAAVRLASSALAWLGDAVSGGTAPPCGYFLRPTANAAAEEGTRFDRTPHFNPERYGSMVPKAFGRRGQNGGEGGGAKKRGCQGLKGY